LYAPSVGRVPLPLFDVRLGTSNLAYDSSGHRVGPPGAACTFAAWSPDGKWMYMSSSRSGTFHTWRQRYPDGPLEQITSGLTEEEGIAMAPDGRSFVAAVAQKQGTVWVHDKNGERQVSLEDYSYDPRFTPDGKKLLYRILKGAVPTFDPGELRLLELDSGHNEPLLPGLFVWGLPGHSYDISPDGKRVVARAADAQGNPACGWLRWIASLLPGKSPTWRVSRHVSVKTDRYFLTRVKRPLTPTESRKTEPDFGFWRTKLPGVRVIEAYGAAPGTTPDVYAFSRSSVQRNL